MEALLVLLYIQTIHYIMIVNFEMEPVAYVFNIILSKFVVI